MNIGVVCAMEREIDLIRETFCGAVEHKAGNMHITQLDAFSHSLFLIISGIGKTCAAMAAQILITAFGCDIIINTGLSGGCDDRLVPGDAVLVKKAFYHDFSYLSLAGTEIGFEDGFSSDQNLIKLAEKVLCTLGFHYITGIAASGDIFVSDKNIKQDIIKRTKCSCVDMEAAAVAHVASANSLPFVILKIVSDSADNKAAEDFEASIELYSSRCVLFVRELVKVL